MVTARRRNETAYTVAQENLGDLKLYRLPVATTIAARASKQVALFTGRSVTFTPYYAAWIGDEGTRAATIGLRTRNRPQEGLGIALPAGPVRVFAAHGDEFLLLGGDGLTDKAVGETVEIGAGTTAQVQVETKVADARGLWRDTVVTVSNANPFAVRFEGNLATDDNERIISHSAPLVRKDGHWQWAAQVPANGRAVLRYRLQRAN
jgi:hypothetical protein